MPLCADVYGGRTLAQRTISTRLAIEGEAAYKQSIANINREYKVLDSSCKSSSEFKGNANSMEALRAKGDALNKLYENQEKRKSKAQKKPLLMREKAQGNYANQVSDYKRRSRRRRQSSTS